MKAIPITPLVLPEAERWMADKYPGKGLFEVNGRVMAVYSPALTGPLMASDIGPSSAYILESAPHQSPEASANSSISESFILKALAIAQQPELATKLL